MLKAHEKVLIKDSWRLLAYFWAIVAAAFAGLHAAGFIDLPATAGSVAQIRIEQIIVQETLESVHTEVNSIHRDRKGDEEKRKSFQRQLDQLDHGQKNIQSDVKSILKLMIQQDKK